MLVDRWITKTIFSSLPLLSCAFSTQFIPYKVTFQIEPFIRYPVDIAAKTSFLSTNIVPFWPKRWRDSILSFSRASAIKLCLAPSWNYSNYRTNSKQPIGMLRSCPNAASTKYTVFLAGPLFPPIRGPAHRLCWIHQVAASLWKSDLLQLDICRLAASCWNKSEGIQQACNRLTATVIFRLYFKVIVEPE